MSKHCLAWLSTILLAAIALRTQPAFSSGGACAYTNIHPAYPPLDAPPIVRAAGADEGTPAPSGADCFGEHNQDGTWITVSTVVRSSLTSRELIQRFGAISELQGLQYWSTTEKTWRPMISAAFAVGSAESVLPRADYAPGELTADRTEYYLVTDTRTYVATHYRLQLKPSPPNTIVVETTNVEPIKKWGITLYRPDGLRTLYFLTRHSPDTWSFYSVTHAVPATPLARGHEKSYINRADALFRHYMRLPVTGAPPAAP